MPAFLFLILFLKGLAAAGEAPEMVPVKGGFFELGDSLGNADERPLRRVWLADFYLGKTEITLGQFRAFVAASGYRTDAERGAGSSVWTPLGWHQQAGVCWRHDETGRPRPPEAADFPVLHLSWNDAARYCNWLSEQEGLRPVYAFTPDTVAIDTAARGYRLPTEAEWEYAAAGGLPRKTTPYAGSVRIGAVGWYAGNAAKGVHPVARKQANALGLYDLTGNVWEWCQDVYAAAPNGRIGPRVIRGGSWTNNPGHCRIANRSSRFPDARDCNLGFRVARSK